MTISRSLLVSSLIVAATSVLLTAIIVATAGYFVTKDEIEDQTKTHLVALRSEQMAYLSSYLEQIKNQIITYSNSYTVQSAANDFINAFNYEERRELSEDTEKSLKAFYRDEFGRKYKERNTQVLHSPDELYDALSTQAKIFQDDFIAKNTNPIEKKVNLTRLPTNSIYSKVHEKYHPELRKYLQTFSYYDIFIIDAKTGNIIYSVSKETDFATSLLDGPYKQSGLAEVFKEARYFSNPDQVSFKDFKPYTPTYEDPAAFIASPVINKDGETIAVLAFQLPIEKINDILTMDHEWEKKGLGETGETYLVSEDFKAQSLSRHLIENAEKFFSRLKKEGLDEATSNIIKKKGTNIGYQEIKTDAVTNALKGEEGYAQIFDYRGVEVISSYAPFEFEGSRFAILAEIDKSEAYSFENRIIRSTVSYALIVSLVMLSIVAFFAWRFSKMLSLRLNSAVQVANGVAQGEKIKIDSNQKQDEIGALMNALNKMQTEVIGKFELAAEESNRITSAVEAASTNIMMADAQYNIIYMNPAVIRMMRTAEKDLQLEIPNFNANDLLGKNIDVFHKNPEHQRAMLAKLTDTYNTTFKVGNRTFSLIATPVFDEQKNRVGTVVEWADKTIEVLIESEVESLIHSANAGDLTKRLDIDSKRGFVKTLSSGLNGLMDQVSAFVTDVGALFEAMSEGNLSKKISNSYQGELEVIKDNANDSLAKLSDVMAKIQRASDIVRSSSQEVAQGSDDLSRRTESQASSLEETAASMEEITSTVKQTADNATQSRSLAFEAKTKAENGGEVVQGAVKAMNDIMTSSNKINDIIGVIDEIAFQTNLLALNAAVEAARAGEQGRGFAVVAGEVRSLSQRSAAAAKEIKDLIRDSVNKVESGSKLVNQSGQMLAEIVQSVDKVATMIADVTSAAIEQNSGINQINQAVIQMDEMTQQNAALVEETSAASRSMSEEARSMGQLISFFQLSHQNEFTDSSMGFDAEPIKSYKASSTAPKKPSTPSKPTNNGNKGAASFSSEDDWEDF